MAGSVLVDILIVRNFLSTTTIRKIANTIATLGPGLALTRSGKFYQELELIPKLEPRRLILWRQPDLGLRTADGGLRVQWLHLLWRTERNRGHRQ